MVILWGWVFIGGVNDHEEVLIVLFLLFRDVDAAMADILFGTPPAGIGSVREKGAKSRMLIVYY